MEHIEWAHPLGVTLREVVVHCHHVYSLASQCIEEHRKCRHEGLTLTGSHLGNLTLVKHDTTDKLHIVVDHIPGHFVTAGHPVVLPYSIISLDAHEILCCAEVAVEISSLYPDDLILLETACCGLHYRECLRKNLVQHLLDGLINLLDELVGLSRKRLLLAYRDLLLKFLLDLGYTVLILSDGSLDSVFKGLTSFTKLIISKFIYLLVCLQHLVQSRSDGFHITVRLGTEKFLENVCK